MQPLDKGAIVVFVSGPYRRPDCCVNTNRAIMVADRLLKLGFAPLVPHLSHLWHTVSPKPDQVWLDLDMVLLRRCDVVLRLEGYSEGADAEVEEAIANGIPVFYSLAGLLDWRSSLRKHIEEDAVLYGKDAA